MSHRVYRRTIEIPWATLLRLVAMAAVVWVFLRLVELLLVLVVAVLLAVTLHPIVAWLEARRFPRWAASAIVAFALLAVVLAFLWMTWSTLAEQGRYLATYADRFERDVLRRLPRWLRNAAGIKGGGDIESSLVPYVQALGTSAASALVVTTLGFVLTVYLLMEGPATRNWLVAFVSRAHRGRVSQTLAESERIIFAYVAGNTITSVICAVCTFIVLWLLHVPAALLLALLAGVSDFVPVIGFIVTAIPAVLAGLSVSTATGLTVLAFYIAYNALESYVISPWVYAGRMRLSNLAVVLAFVIGAELGGVIGALIALPIAAIYPSIERIWLREHVGEETVREHRAIERQAG